MKQEFLNEEKRQFKDCTREQQHILLDAILDGKCQSYHFYQIQWFPLEQTLGIDITGIYRTKPIKRLAIPWEHIKPEYRWAAMDFDSNVYVSKDKPSPARKGNYWIAECSSSISAFKDIDTSGIDWRDSLVERPADK